MSDDLIIGFQANTGKFQMDVNKAFETVQNFANKSGDAGKEIEKSFKKLSQAAANGAGEIQKAFSSLNIPSDFTMKLQQDQLQRAKQFFQAQFEGIANDANSSADEVMRAFRALNNIETKLDATALKNEFTTLGIQSTASIEAMKTKIINDFKEIEVSGTKYPQDIVRAEEAMVAKITELNKLLVPQSEQLAAEQVALAEKAAAAKVLAEEEAAAKQTQIWNKLRADSIRQETQRIIQAQETAIKLAQIAKEQAAAEVVAVQQAMAAKMEAAEKYVDKQIALQRELKAVEQGNYAAQGMSQPGAANTLINQPLAGSKFSNGIKEQMEAAAAEAKIMQDAILMNQKFDFDKIRSAKLAADAKVIAEQESIAKINQLHEQALRMDIERDSAMVVSRELALRKMTLAYEQASKLNSLYDKGAVDGHDELIKSIETATHGISGFSIASVAAIAKVQIMYSLINQVMSLIGSAPTVAVEAIESFNSAAITNAALITSMQGNVKDVGKAYQENKVYALAVQQVLVKMDAETSASAANLSDMNRAFIAQGVILDVNNAKQIEGFKNTANAIEALTHGNANQGMQYTQEVKSMLKGEDRAGNQLFQALNGMDNGKLKEHLAEWQKIAKETNNYGLILEKIGPMLQGFAAAQGDINGLWSTTKSTMATIRDEILRGGLSEGFAEIVTQMKEIQKWAEANKESIQALLRDGFSEAKNVASKLWTISKALASIAEPAMYLAIGVGISKITAEVVKLGVVLKSGSLATLMTNLPMLAAAAGMYVGKSYADAGNLDKQAADIRSKVPTGHDAKRMQNMGIDFKQLHLGEFTGKQLKVVQEQLPLATNSQIAMLIQNGAVQLVKKTDAAFNEWWYVVEVNKKKAESLLGTDEKVKTPTGLNPGAGKGEKGKQNDTGLENAKEAYLKAVAEQNANTQIIANKRLSEINEQGYAEGIVDIKTYLAERERLIEANLQFEITAKETEVANAKKHQDAFLNSKITTTDANGKVTRDLNAEAIRNEKAKTDVINARIALANAKNKLEQAAASSVKFDETTKDNVQKWVDSYIAGAEKISKHLVDAEMLNIDKMQNSKEYKVLSPAQKKDVDNAAVTRAQEAINKDNMEAALGLRNLKQEEIQDQLMLLDMSEKMYEISSYDAVVKRLPLEKELADVQKSALDSIDKKKDPSTWFKQNMIYMQLMMKANADMKKQMDLNPQGDKQKLVKAVAYADNYGKIQSAIGGDNYGSKFQTADSAYVIEKAKLQEQYNEKLILKEDFNARMLQADQLYAAQKNSIGLSMASDSIGIMKQSFADNKTMMIIALALETAISIARIMMNAEVAKSAAIASAAMLGPIAGPAAAAANVGIISAGEAMQIGTVLGSGAIQGMSIAGKRALGGPVTAGQTYIVNENRASQGPELFTPGANGVITPANKLGGSTTYAPVYQIDARNSTLNEAQITSIVKRANETSKAEILNSMNRGGEFALASGRMR